MKISLLLASCVRSVVRVRAALLLVSALITVSGTARAQTIFVADPNGTNGVRSYNINGTLINNSLVPGDGFQGLALSGSTLYISDASSGAASIRTATLNGSGGVSSTGFATIGEGGTGLTSPFGLALTATNFYVANFNTGSVLKYNFSGTQVASPFSLINNNGGINPNPYGLAVHGDTMWVSQATTGTGLNTIKGFSLTAGFSAPPTFTITSASGLSGPNGLTVSGDTLYVANAIAGNILTFNAAHRGVDWHGGLGTN